MMDHVISVDLGTSSIRAMLVAADGTRVATAAVAHQVSIPAPGFAEQDPERWYQDSCEAIRAVLEKSSVPVDRVRALGFSGQMHGVVYLGAAGTPLGPAIIWQDQRSHAHLETLSEEVSHEAVVEYTQNRLSPGFLGASLFWISKEAPELFSRIKHVMLPKDFLKYKLTGGVIQTDFSDAGGTGIFDNVRLRWSDQMCQLLGIPTNILPRVGSSTEVVGFLSGTAAQATGLRQGTAVTAGGGDQCMQQVGNGVIEEGSFSVNVGTGGQVSTIVEDPFWDPLGRVNLFPHVLPRKWNLVGATLSAGSSLKWLARSVFHAEDFGALDERAAQIPPGSGGLIFLPHLGGERTPLMDPLARGAFLGLTPSAGQGNLSRAVMEGVAFSLRECLEILEELTGTLANQMVVSGGGARSRLWRQILADVLGVELRQSRETEQASLGAAMTAGVSVGIYADFKEAKAVVCDLEMPRTQTDASTWAVYERMFELYVSAHRKNRALLHALQEIDQQTSSKEAQR